MRSLLVRFSDGQIIGVDKMLHFAFSFIIAAFFNNLYIGFAVVVIIAFLKEFFDKYIKKSQFDYKDIIAGILGGLFYVLVAIIKITI